MADATGRPAKVNRSNATMAAPAIRHVFECGKAAKGYIGRRLHILLNLFSLDTNTTLTLGIHSLTSRQELILSALFTRVHLSISASRFGRWRAGWAAAQFHAAVAPDTAFARWTTLMDTFIKTRSRIFTAVTFESALEGALEGGTGRGREKNERGDKWGHKNRKIKRDTLSAHCSCRHFERIKRLAFLYAFFL